MFYNTKIFGNDIQKYTKEMIEKSFRAIKEVRRIPPYVEMMYGGAAITMTPVMLIAYGRIPGDLGFFLTAGQFVSGIVTLVHGAYREGKRCKREGKISSWSL